MLSFIKSKSKLKSISKILSSFFALFLLAGLAQSAFATGTLVPVHGDTDMVYDQARQILYITRGSSVLRYSLNTNTFLMPFEFFGTLKGIDISPDSNTLVVADVDLFGVFLVDLETNEPKRAIYQSSDDHERGSVSVAFADNNTVLVTTDFSGSAWTPLRKYNLTTNQFTSLGKIRAGSMLSASADHSVVGVAEDNASDGPFDLYNVASDTLLNSGRNGTKAFNFDIAVNRNGTQSAILNNGNIVFVDSKLNIIPNSLNPGWQKSIVGVAYHPVQDILYLTWANTSEVVAYDANTKQKITSYNVDSVFSYTYPLPFFNDGRIKLSPDGKYLFVRVGGGIQYIDLSQPDQKRGV